ncbi:hypothetical protein HYFRA_00007528 [Hymenoscyphus fraxineus]|uniref:Uncharacterized protein n=1 Tax=Hymenoscyphus fraxineus TaxID=746836 RepID=A0A9N9KVD5_9HELO|nr:hypothetical protein HYFRA_00007528 [Hymenoscyphus fraxineus]
MSIQRTGLKIKQFLSLNRKHHTFDDSVDNIDSISFVEPKQSTNTPRKLSWRLSQKSQETSSSTPRRTSSSTTIKSYQLPSATESPYSSQSSLCSCDCETNQESIEYSLFRTAPLPNPFEILYQPPLSPSRATGDAQTWKLIFPESLSRSRSSSYSRYGETTSSGSTIRVSSFETIQTIQTIENHRMGREDKPKPPRQSVAHREDMERENISADVDQLIKDTDEAFQAVGSALASAKASTRGWYGESIANTRHETRSNPIATPPKQFSPSPRGISKKTSRSQLLPPSPRPIPVSLSAKRKNSVVSKKKKSTGVFSRALRRGQPVRLNAPPRWNISDVTTNVVDVFSGKLFRTTEVDEMLTPGRLQQIRQDMKLEVQRKNSFDSGLSIETAGSDTPTSPFHLESLSTRIDAANSFTRSAPAPVPPMPLLPPPPLPRHDKTSLENQTRVHLSDPERTDDRMMIADLRFPSPPSPPSGSLKSHQFINEPPILPTIPEVSPFNLSTEPVRETLPSTLQRTHSSPSSESDEDDTIKLPSTLYTTTSPFFQHGPILFSRALLAERQREALLEAKYDSLNTFEDVDWTAFQMAIQGTMDLPIEDSTIAEGNEPNEPFISEDEEDYYSWWLDFHLGPIGGMGTRASSPWGGSASSGILELEADLTFGEEQGDAKLLDVDMLAFPSPLLSPPKRISTPPPPKRKSTPPPPVPPRSRSARVRTKPRPFSFQLSSAGSEELSVLDLRSRRDQNVPAHSLQHTIARPMIEPDTIPFVPRPLDTPASTASFPMSPMAQLTGQGEGEVVMGSNLHHDLGDFLSWESQFVPFGEEDNMLEGVEEEEDLYGA